MTIRYSTKSTQVIPFNNQELMVVSAMVDKNQLLDNFTMDELLAECNRRHSEGNKKLVPVSASIFFETNPTDFKIVEEDK